MLTSKANEKSQQIAAEALLGTRIVATTTTTATYTQAMESMETHSRTCADEGRHWRKECMLSEQQAGRTPSTTSQGHGRGQPGFSKSCP